MSKQPCFAKSLASTNRVAKLLGKRAGQSHGVKNHEVKSHEVKSHEVKGQMYVNDAIRFQ